MYTYICPSMSPLSAFSRYLTPIIVRHTITAIVGSSTMIVTTIGTAIGICDGIIGVGVGSGIGDDTGPEEVSLGHVGVGDGVKMSLDIVGAMCKSVDVM